MESLLSDSFPARAPGKGPSSSGGFYKYPKSIRSLPELKMSKVKTGPSTHILVESPNTAPKRSPIFRDYSPRAIAEGTFTIHRPHLLATSDSVASLSRPPLVNSFKEILEHHSPEEFVNLLPGKRHAQTQTTFDNVYSVDVSEISNYKLWLRSRVDPFLKDLKKAILDNKPDDVAAYCAVYCLAVTCPGEPLPIPKTLAIQKTFRKPTTAEDQSLAKNKVGTANSIIRLQSRKSAHQNLSSSVALMSDNI